MSIRACCRGPWILFALLGCALIWSVPPAVAQKDKLDPAATRDYAVAIGLQNKQLFEQALGRWQKFIKAYPADPRVPTAYHHLGTCQLQRKQYKDAAVTYKDLLAKFPKLDTRDAAHLNLGLALYYLGTQSKKAEDLKEAAKAFAEVPAKHPKSKHAATALYYQGEALYQAGDLKQAAASYRKLASDYPAGDLVVDAIYALGTSHQELGQDKEAALVFEELLKKFPKDRLAAESRLRLGQSLLKQKRYAEAQQAFAAAAAATDFAYADFALLQQAECLHAQGQMPQAAALYEQVPQKFPKSKYAAAALLSAGKSWYRAAKLTEAQASLAKVVALKTEEAAEAGYWLAQTLLGLKKPAEAAAAADQALAANPKGELRPQLLFLKASAAYEQPGQVKQAAALFADLAKKHPESELLGRALYMASLSALRVEDHAAAQAHAEAFLAAKQLAKDELLPEVLFLAGESYLNAPKPDAVKAEPFYRRLADEHPKHPQAAAAQLRVGACLYVAKKHADALVFLTKSVEGLKDDTLRAESHLLMGRCQADLGKTVEAAAAFRKALEAKPDWEHADEARLALAASLRAQKKPAEAADELSRLVKDFPKSIHRPRARHQLGELAVELGKHDDALKHYARVLAEQPKGELALLARFGTGAAHFGKKDYAKAVQSLSEVLADKVAPEVAARARYIRGLAYQRLGQHAPAAADLAAFIAAKPPTDAADARFALALSQAAQDQHAQAAATLAALLQDEPTFARADQAYYEMAFSLLQAKKTKEAADAFRTLATKHPDSPLATEALFRVGDILEDGGKTDEAAKAFALGLDKAKPGALREKLRYKVGWCHYRGKRYAEAAAMLQLLLKENPKNALAGDAAYLCGECLYQMAKRKEALPYFEQIVAAADKKYHARALYRAAACHADLRDWPNSQKRYAALLDEFPKFDLAHEARYGLGWALQNQDKIKEAVEAYTLVTKATNGETAAKSRFMIGECAFKEKKYKEAVEHFFETALGYPYKEWQALSYFEAGRCFIELKDTKRALEALETVVSKHADHPRAKDAARLIADLKK